MDIINKINNFILKQQQRIYLKPGEKPPKGVQVQRGSKGGLFYISGVKAAKGPAPVRTIKPIPKRIEEIWGGSGIELLRGQYGEKGSISFTKENIPDAIKKIKWLCESKTKDMSAEVGHTKIKKTIKGLTFADYQGRKLHLPYKEVSQAIKVLEAHK